MSRSNHNKPFYVDIGTSVVAIRCASNHDVVAEYNHVPHSYTLNLAKEVCDRMNKEAGIATPRLNCEVGTVAEQSDRFDDWCHAHKRGRSCADCKLNESIDLCAIAWAQMPYTKGDNNGDEK